MNPTMTHRMAWLMMSAGLAIAAPAHALPPSFDVNVGNPPEAPVNVRTTVRKIPVTCSEVIGLTPDDGLVTPNCQRVDTGAPVFPVEAGMSFALTDMLTNRNALIAAGVKTFFLTARSSGGGDYIDWSGDPALSPARHFTTPMVFVHSGDSLEISNGDISVSGGLVDVFVSGYLIATQDLGY